MPYESPTQRMRALLAARLRRVREYLFAKRLCGDAIRALRSVRAARPDLAGDGLCEAMLRQWEPSLELEPRAIMRRTRESIEGWDLNREPGLVDVISYVIVTEFLKRESGAAGMNMNLQAFVSRRLERGSPAPHRV